MNGIDTFLDINNAHLRVNSGNVQASTFVLDQINIVTSANTATTVNFNNVTKAFNAASNIEVGTANLFVDTTTSKVGIGTDAPAYTLDVHGSANVGALTATTFSGSGAGLTALDAANITTGTLDAARVPDLEATKITTGTLNAARIPDLDAAKITTGTLDAARVPDLDAAKITTGTLDAARVPVPTTFGGATFSGDVTVDADTFHVDTTNNRVGVGTSSPIASLDIDGGPENDIVPALSIRGGLYDTSDLYVLNTYNVNTGAGYAAKVIGVNIKNKVETDNTVQLRNNVGGLTSAGAIYLGSDNANQGVFGVLTCQGSAGTTLTEKFTITDSGNVGIGKTDPGYTLDVRSDTGAHVERDDNQTYETVVAGGSIFIRNPSTSGGYEHMIINNHATGSHSTSYIQFRRGNTGNGGAIGTITGNGSTISYGTGSDYRLKTNIVPMPISGLDTINNLQPKRFNFISNPSETVDGFIAHELQEHIPMAVTGEKDEMRGRGNVVKIDDESFIVKEDVSEPDHLEEGTKWVKLTEVPVYQNVDLSKVVTYLVKAVQELSEENRTLKTRLEALENA